MRALLPQDVWPMIVVAWNSDTRDPHLRLRLGTPVTRIVWDTIERYHYVCSWGLSKKSGENPGKSGQSGQPQGKKIRKSDNPCPYPYPYPYAYPYPYPYPYPYQDFW